MSTSHGHNSCVSTSPTLLLYIKKVVRPVNRTPDYRSVVASQVENIRVPSMFRQVQFLVDDPPGSFEEHEEHNDGGISSQGMAKFVETETKDHLRQNNDATRDSSNENCYQNDRTKLRLKYSKDLPSCATCIPAWTTGRKKENDFMLVDDPCYHQHSAQHRNRSLRTLWIINEVISILHEEEEAMSWKDILLS